MATMTDGPISVTVLLRFDAAGLIASIYDERRATILDGTTVRIPWEGRMSNYQTQDGVRILLTAEVLYITRQRDRLYFKDTIKAVAYEFAL